jgi:hypothetical protein
VIGNHTRQAFWMDYASRVDPSEMLPVPIKDRAVRRPGGDSVTSHETERKKWDDICQDAVDCSREYFCRVLLLLVSQDLNKVAVDVIWGSRSDSIKQPFRRTPSNG